ncbi:MAG TPA: response regulator transcription factor [Terriglobia bacterium]|nr:response regulator transcription factor [Terriglobia bacterium]
MATRILLAEDHQVVREGLRALLEREGFTVVGEASDGREAVRLAGELKPEVAIFDIGMPMLNGIDAARETQAASPRTQVVLLSVHSEDPYVRNALEAGVRAYVLKSKAAKDLIQAIRDVSKGLRYMSPEISQTIMDSYVHGAKPKASSAALTPRERQVLQLVAEGKSTKEVASILGISVKTADSHRSRIMQKLDIHDTATLVRYAVRTGMVQP